MAKWGVCGWKAKRGSHKVYKGGVREGLLYPSVLVIQRSVGNKEVDGKGGGFEEPHVPQAWA